jgi:hypothetical protein
MIMDIRLPSIHILSPVLESIISMQNKGSTIPLEMAVEMTELARYLGVGDKPVQVLGSREHHPPPPLVTTGISV